MRIWSRVMGLAAVAAMVAGCSSGSKSSTPSGCTTASATLTTAITISGFSFQPSCAELPAGGHVTWTNSDTTSHTATSDAVQPDAFDSGTLAQNASFSTTLTSAGTVAYHCKFHSNMHATLIVP